MVSRKILLTPIGLSLPPPSPPPPLSIESSTHFFADARSQSNYNQLKTTSIIMLLLILAIVFLLSMSLHLLLRFLDPKREDANTTSDEFRTESTDRHPAEYRPHDEQQNPQQRSNGMSNNNLVDSLPVFSFGSVNRRSNNQRLDCAVCLSPFQSDDRLRLLPYCTHAFHADCIGTWLLTNTTCPLCRSDLTAVPSCIAVVGQAAAGNDREETESVKSSVGGRSFRIELGSVSGRSIAGGGGSRRTYSMGSFEYVVPESSMPEVFLADQEKSYGGVYGRGELYSVERVGVYLPESKVVDSGGVGGTSRNWLRDYLERIVTTSTPSFSMRTASFRSINEGGSRRIDAIPATRLEAESQSSRLMAAAESFLLFLRSDM